MTKKIVKKTSKKGHFLAKITVKRSKVSKNSLVFCFRFFRWRAKVARRGTQQGPRFLAIFRVISRLFGRARKGRNRSVFGGSQEARLRYVNKFQIWPKKRKIITMGNNFYKKSYKFFLHLVVFYLLSFFCMSCKDFVGDPRNCSQKRGRTYFLGISDSCYFY